MEKEILFIKITVSLVLESRVLKLIYDGVERKDDELGCYMATESSLGLLGDIDLLILGISFKGGFGVFKDLESLRSISPEIIFSNLSLTLEIKKSKFSKLHLTLS